jgi:hypothetical protein
MPGESPSNMMRADGRRRRQGAASAPSRRPWPVLMPMAIVVVIAVGWCWLWYYAASDAERTLAAWTDRETAAGRSYSCGAQGIAGFPFRIEARCVDAAASIKTAQQSFTVATKAITVTAAIYHPTFLVADIVGPLSFAELAKPPSFAADWSSARVSLRGLPPEPQEVSVNVEQMRLDRAPASSAAAVFQADHVEMDSRLVDGSAIANPVIETVVHFTGASAPTIHPILAEPLDGESTAVLRGLKDLSPKPWPDRFREMQAAGGTIEVKSLRLAQADAILVGTGTLSINEHGKLDGLLQVAIVGLDHIVPLLGIDTLIGQSIDRLAGQGGQGAQGLNALDRLLPGLGGAVRQTTNASLIENLKKMGQPTEIDGKPAVLLPLRVSDGFVSLGMIPVGEIPPLF